MQFLIWCTNLVVLHPFYHGRSIFSMLLIKYYSIIVPILLLAIVIFLVGIVSLLAFLPSYLIPTPFQYKWYPFKAEGYPSNLHIVVILQTKHTGVPQGRPWIAMMQFFPIIPVWYYNKGTILYYALFLFPAIVIHLKLYPLPLQLHTVP